MLFATSQAFREKLANLWQVPIIRQTLSRRGLVHYRYQSLSFVRDQFLSRKNMAGAAGELGYHCCFRSTNRMYL